MAQPRTPAQAPLQCDSGNPATRPSADPQPQPYTLASEQLEAAIAILSQGEALLAGLSPEEYSQQLPLAFNASIGGHYRHCLDHFRTLAGSLESGKVNYDDRARDPRMESNIGAAIEATRALRGAYEALRDRRLDAPLSVRCQVRYRRVDAPSTHSSFGRELVYVVAHAIHHYALIAIMGRMMNVPLPQDFGLAPSTLSYRTGDLAATHPSSQAPALAGRPA